MAELRVSVGSFGLTILAALGVSCGGTTEVTGGTGASPGTGGNTSVGGGWAITGGTAGAGGSAGGPVTSTCTPIAQDQGFTQCAEGWTHRTASQTCPSAVPRLNTTCTASLAGTCTVDSDCASMPYGYCSTAAGAAGCYCSGGCVSDSDCAAGTICMCGDPVGHCVAASCHSDAECPGEFCASYDATAGCGGIAFACSTPRDECHSGTDCAGGYCVLAADGHRQCATMGCAIGRPFLVGNEDRLASPRARGDWALNCAAIFDAVSEPAQRERLSEYYQQVALMEHASVAAFARLTMQLMSLGAPAELVELAVAAQRDETAHARLAFGLASELAGVKMGPGALSIEGAFADSSPAHMAFTAVVEGCVGETIAALEAAELSTRVTQPELRALLEQIARDESEHARLAYQVVAWLLEVGGAEVKQAVEQGFQAALDRSTVPRRIKPEDANFGALDNELAAEVRHHAVRQIVVPAAAALGVRCSPLAQAA